MTGGQGQASNGSARGVDSGPAPSNNPLNAVVHAVDPGGSMGGSLLWALLGVTVLFAAAGWLRYRSGPRSQ
jgi:hypothetical protein